jgi:gliding motility-associated-like protein
LTANQDVTVTVTNPLNTNCVASDLLKFRVNPTPKIDLNLTGQADELVCSNIPTFTVAIDAGINDGSPTTNYNYKWFKDGVAITGATNYTLNVNAAGLYAVEVSYPLTSCVKTRTIKVTASDIATINSITIEDLADVNSVTVSVIGSGNYVYSIDNPFGPFQTETFFTNVDIGEHTLYIKDLYGCGIVSKVFYILGTPRFFTPNGDGYNDTWNVKGVDPNLNSLSIVHIFDRYGKLVKQISPIGAGWDGTMNGYELPSDDYWFSIKFEDGRSTKGHFALKR